MRVRVKEGVFKGFRDAVVGRYDEGESGPTSIRVGAGRSGHRVNARNALSWLADENPRVYWRFIGEFPEAQHVAHIVFPPDMCEVMPGDH